MTYRIDTIKGYLPGLYQGKVIACEDGKDIWHVIIGINRKSRNAALNDAVEYGRELMAYMA